MGIDSANSSDIRSRWFQRARQGEATAVAHLLHWYRPLLVAMARGRLPATLRRRADESDVVQEVLHKAVRAFSGAHFADRQALAAWLGKILRHEIIAVQRRAAALKCDVRRERSLDSDEAQRQLVALSLDRALAEEARFLPDADHAQVAAAVERLPTHYRFVLRLRYQEALPFADIGARLERSADAVRMLHDRAIAKLQQMLCTNSAREKDLA